MPIDGPSLKEREKQQALGKVGPKDVLSKYNDLELKATEVAGKSLAASRTNQQDGSKQGVDVNRNLLQFRLTPPKQTAAADLLKLKAALIIQHGPNRLGSDRDADTRIVRSFAGKFFDEGTLKTMSKKLKNEILANGFNACIYTRILPDHTEEVFAQAAIVGGIKRKDASRQECIDLGEQGTVKE